MIIDRIKIIRVMIDKIIHMTDKIIIPVMKDKIIIRMIDKHKIITPKAMIIIIPVMKDKIIIRMIVIDKIIIRMIMIESNNKIMMHIMIDNMIDSLNLHKTMIMMITGIFYKGSQSGDRKTMIF